MRISNSYFVVIILFIAFSCIDKKNAEKASVLELQNLEVDLSKKPPKNLTTGDFNRNFKSILKNYIDTVSLSQYFKDQPNKDFLENEVRKFYKSLDYHLAWNSAQETYPVSNELIGLLNDSYKNGLNPSDYKVEEIISRQKNLFQHGKTISSLQDLLQLDLFMTSKYILLGYHSNIGRVNPVEVLDSWHIKRGKANLADTLSQGLINKNLTMALEKLEPNHQEYKNLKEEFLKYYNLIEDGNIVELDVSSLEQLAPKDSSEAISKLKKLLMGLGDYPKENKPENVYDEKLIDALKKYQSRHGLEVNGKLDEPTLSKLQIPLNERLLTINLNLERAKWLPEFDDRYIVVNVPEFKMKLFDDARQVMEMKAIVGEDVNRTPIMTEKMSYIVFNPTWTVPNSISTEEFLPKIKKDDNFLLKNNYLLYENWEEDAKVVDPKKVDWEKYSKDNFPFKVVQKSGPNNALGKVQFMMPNNLAIYLHDTPADYLFGKDKRAFSHGCIRLEKPFELAKYLLRDKPDWNVTNMQEALAKEEPVNVALHKNWPVYLLYQTAWVDENGDLNFRDDVYGLDDEQIAAFDRLDLNFPVVRKD